MGVEKLGRVLRQAIMNIAVEANYEGMSVVRLLVFWRLVSKREMEERSSGKNSTQIRF